MADDDVPCPLCGSGASPTYFVDGRRRYACCAVCALVFVHPADRPRPLDETLRYLEHENRRDDAGYAGFLGRLENEVCARFPIGARGLDVGCGPTPLLSELLTRSGRPTEHYDPLFFPRGELLQETYDFATCCEVVEHAHDPAALFGQLARLIGPGGLIAIMTQFRPIDHSFGSWWYRRDATHVGFFSERTLRWVASHFGLRVTFPVASIALLTRSGGSARQPNYPGAP